MSTMQLVTLSLLVVLVFWAIGAHNRIVEMRNAIGKAYAQIDAQLRLRHQLLPQLVGALRAKFASEASVLDAVLAASEQANVAATAVRARPGAARVVASLSLAEQVLAATLARLQALLAAQPLTSDDPHIVAFAAELAAIEQKLAFARQLFNAAALSYNDAVRQFPTSMLAPLFRFTSAGQL
jgi:LemA protein